MLSTIAETAKELLHTPRQEFMESNAPLALLFQPFAMLSESGFGTLEGGGSGRGGTAQVGWLRKRKGSNAFGTMVTLGRTSNNDLVVSCGSVSKFHAYFDQDAQGTWRVSDASSTHGTTLNDLRLAPRTPTVIKAGDTLGFSDGVYAVVHSPASLHDYCTRLYGR